MVQIDARPLVMAVMARYIYEHVARCLFTAVAM